MQLPPNLQAFHAHVAARKSVATADAYLRGARSFEDFLERSAVVLGEAPPGLPDQFVTWLQGNGIAPRTVSIYVYGMNAYLDFRRKQGESIPAFAKPDMPRAEPNEIRILDEAELRVFFAMAAQTPEPMRTCLILMPLSGLRSKEMVRIQMTDVVVKDGVVYFDVSGKGRKRRTIPLLKQANGVLRKYLSGWRAEVSTKVQSPWLFPGKSKVQPLTTRVLRQRMAEIRARMGNAEDRLTPHTLRKTYLTYLDAVGVSPFKVAQLAGHSTLRTTGDHYIHHRPEALASDLAHVQLPASPTTKEPT
jgi:site-specific recombinase XerD